MSKEICKNEQEKRLNKKYTTDRERDFRNEGIVMLSVLGSFLKRFKVFNTLKRRKSL